MDLWLTERHDDVAGHTFKVNQTLYHAQSDFQTIDIVETEAYGRMLLLDGMVMTTEKDEFIYHEMISHIPMLAHPNPKQVLVIGGGDGGTVREVLKHPSVERVVLCEIDGMVIDSCREFLPSIAGRLDDPRVDIQVGDGVAYIAKQKKAFDVILIDSTDPLGPGEGLFTEAFYNNVLAALTPQGIMAAQSESPIADQREIRLVYQLLHKVFPVVHTYVAPIPTYPGGFWSWSFCSNEVEPFENVDPKRVQAIEETTKYFNSEIHKAVFALPNYVKNLVSPGVSVAC